MKFFQIGNKRGGFQSQTIIRRLRENDQLSWRKNFRYGKKTCLVKWKTWKKERWSRICKQSASGKSCKNEKEPLANVQYSRRNNPEFVGIPSNISQEDLEDNIIQILKSIAVDVQPEDIEPCHRLDYVKNESKNNPKRTIVKFLNRKNSKLGYNRV